MKLENSIDWCDARIETEKTLTKKARRLDESCICDTCRQTRAFHYLADTGFCGCGGTLRRIRFFAYSNSDWLDGRWPVEKRVELLGLIRECQSIDWLLLTKRPENWYPLLVQAVSAAIDTTPAGDELPDWIDSWIDCGDMPERGDLPTNVWLGVSVEDQTRANERIPELLKIPAAVRFLSMEPLLEAVDLTQVRHQVEPGFFGDCLHWDHRPIGFSKDYPVIDWVIIGGESDQPNADARPCNIDWVRRIVLQCQADNVPVYVKQLGSHQQDGEDESMTVRLRHSAGTDPAEWPEDLRVRKFPKGVNR